MVWNKDLTWATFVQNDAENIIGKHFHIFNSSVLWRQLYSDVILIIGIGIQVGYIPFVYMTSERAQKSIKTVVRTQECSLLSLGSYNNLYYKRNKG